MSPKRSTPWSCTCGSPPAPSSRSTPAGISDPRRRTMRHEPQERVIVTCAVTGNITTREQHPDLPITPKEIADASLEAAATGAAIVHIHVRHPDTGKPSMELAYYGEVVERIRAQDRELILNLTTGLGGRFI